MLCTEDVDLTSRVLPFIYCHVTDIGRYGLYREANNLDVRRMMYNLVLFMLVICWPGATISALVPNLILLCVGLVSISYRHSSHQLM